jgi:tetratricopeptide (TPR) repeat protein
MQTSKRSLRKLSAALSVASVVGCAGAHEAFAAGWFPWSKSTPSATATAASAVPSDSVPRASSFWQKKPATPPLPVSKPIPPGAGPDLLVATARIHEAAGRNEEADQHYQMALKIDGRHYDALLGCAHLLDRQSRFSEATAFYERATTAYPADPAPLNDLGLCLARRRMYDKAAETLRQAVALAPTNKLYRNNLATVLLETGDRPGALQEMTAAHGEAIAHYNLGCLLQRKGKTQDAAAEFRAALAVDPKLMQANEWLAKLERPTHAPTAVAARPAAPVQRKANLQVKPGAPNAQPARRWGQVSNTTTGLAPSPGEAPTYLLGGNAQTQTAPATTMNHPQSGWGQYGGEAPAAPTPEDLDRAGRQGLSALPPVTAEYYPPSRY